MNKKIKILFTLLIFIVGNSLVLLAPAKEISVFKKAPAPEEGYALVYFYRLKVPPYLMKPKIDMEGKEIFKLPNYGYGYFYVKEGAHILQTKWSFITGAPPLEFAFQVEKGKTYYMRLVGMVQSGLFSGTVASGVEFVDEVLALKELELVKKYIPALLQKLD